MVHSVLSHRMFSFCGWPQAARKPATVGRLRIFFSISRYINVHITCVADLLY